jgi:hypothetical protein
MSNDGGPAFPVTAGQQVYATGISLRDWFAGQAPGLHEETPRTTAEALAGPPPAPFDGMNVENMRLWFEWWARADAAARYVQADAMLAARALAAQEGEE